MDRLLQDIYRDDPWKVLVSCIMLNCTRREQVDGIRDEFFKRYPNPAEFVGSAQADPDSLKRLIAPLGFVNVRSLRLRAMSYEYMMMASAAGRVPTSHEVMSFSGCGEYARDSYAIFVEGRTDVMPADKELRKYLQGQYGGPRVIPAHNAKVT